MPEFRRKIRQSNWWGRLLLLRHLLRHLQMRRGYFQQIDQAVQERKVVVSLQYGGIGDCLAYSSLPRLLHERLGVDFYLSESSRAVVRNPDTLKLCFELNPYFKGYAPDAEAISLGGYSRTSIFSPVKSLVEFFESQFKVADKGLPELYYQPLVRSDLSNTLLVDTNTISGRDIGWIMDEDLTRQIIDDAQRRGLKILYVDPKGQGLFDYVDMIGSSKEFLCYLSGSHALAAALHKPATVILPENFDGGGISKFIYPHSSIRYLRKRSIRRYMRHVRT